MTSPTTDRASLKANAFDGSTTRLWVGRIMTAVAVLFLILDAVLKMIKLAPMAEGMMRLGYPDSVTRGIGLLLLVCVAVYMIPRTAVLGAILLTGYLGGAVATHVRIGSPFFTDILLPVYVGVMLWGGLYARGQRVRALIPTRSDR